ncbi:MAG: hypothetical protein KF777_10310 [Planctomycetaceae bacterium]|nr:hypothetical protein [Planctomycetaceae bacterium]
MNPIKLLGMAAFSLVVLAVALPPLDQGRQEARFAQAYSQARAIQQGQLSAETLDPWGSPYLIIEGKETIIRVVSSGPNGTSHANGFDDDIWSDMTEPPHRRFERARNWRLALTFALAASPWLIVIVRRVARGVQNGSIHVTK